MISIKEFSNIRQHDVVTFWNFHLRLNRCPHVTKTFLRLLRPWNSIFTHWTSRLSSLSLLSSSLYLSNFTLLQHSIIHYFSTSNVSTSKVTGAEISRALIVTFKFKLVEDIRAHLIDFVNFFFYVLDQILTPLKLLGRELIVCDQIDDSSELFFNLWFFVKTAVS